MALWGLGAALVSNLSRQVLPVCVATKDSSDARHFLHRFACQPVTATVSSLLNPARSISLSAVVFNVRNHFPRPSEIKRVKRYGWKARMSTPNGRKVIMRRILKGRHVLTH